MKIKIMMFLLLGASIVSVCFAQSYYSGNESANSNATMGNKNNVSVNAETNTGVTTNMNGNTSTKSGGSISSTSASAESRNASGSN